MIIFVTGSEYGLGRIFADEFISRGHEVIGDTGINISDVNFLYEFLKIHRPDAVVHCKRDLPSPELTMEKISFCCSELSIPIMFVSSSSVFGENERVSERTPRYPITKKGLVYYNCENTAAKCKRFIIYRLPDNMFGCGDEDIAARLLSLGKRKKELILNSEKGFSVVYANDAAELGADILESGKSGIFHGANEGLCTEFSLACELYRLTRLAGNEDYYDITVHPTALGGRAFEMQCVSIRKIGIEPLESWQSALERFTRRTRPF